MLILFILGIPLVLIPIILLCRQLKLCAVINAIGYALVLFISTSLLFKIAVPGRTVHYFNFFYLDALSIFFLFVISTVAFATALYSISYISKDVKEGIISEKKARFYYTFFNLFCFSMFFVPVVNNLGMLWVAVEMTTLISAFLVGFYNTKKSVEAAWKYIIICSLGIILALLGTILFSYAFSMAGGGKSLNWTDLLSFSSKLDKNIIKIAFIFILVGFGTKAGLAPMHTWLPDAHSQAVSPISALLSGVLLKTAVYAILRFAIITNKCVGQQFSGNLFLLLGLISLAISCSFSLMQKDLKRLLAYSSIEHIGIIFFGFGIGSPIGYWGALLHIFNHAVTKSLMFFGAGNIVSAYKKHNMNAIRGVIKAMPFTGIVLLFGVFGLMGFPPFSIFVSELLIIIAAFTKSLYFAAGLFLFFLAIIFAAIINRFGRMLFGNMPKDMQVSPAPLGVKVSFLFLLLQISIFGILLPLIFKGAFLSAIKLLQGAN